jgi:hypothetical protein
MSVGRNIPGPGAYKVEERIGKEGNRYSMMGKPKILSESMKVPGPAAYNVNIIKKNAGYKFGQEGVKKGKKIKSNVPGPGQYDVRTRYHNLKAASPVWK